MSILHFSSQMVPWVDNMVAVFSCFDKKAFYINLIIIIFLHLVVFEKKVMMSPAQGKDENIHKTEQMTKSYRNSQKLRELFQPHS